MNDEMKPVRCGCGGEAQIRAYCTLSGESAVYVSCSKCDISTQSFLIADEAIKAWNRAMVARTAKVESRKWQKDLTLIGGGSWSGKCQGCGRWVKSNECTYCPNCGAKLDWGKDE